MRITFFPKENALHEPQGPCSSQGGENPTPLGSSPANPDLKGSLSQNSSLLSCNMKQYWRCHPCTVTAEPPPTTGTSRAPPQALLCPLPGWAPVLGSPGVFALVGTAVTCTKVLWATGLPARGGDWLLKQQMSQKGEMGKARSPGPMQNKSTPSPFFSGRFWNASLCSQNRKVILPEPGHTYKIQSRLRFHSVDDLSALKTLSTLPPFRVEPALNLEVTTGAGRQR